MSFKDCVKIIKESSADLFDDKTAEELLNRISEMKRVRRNTSILENADQALYNDLLSEIQAKKTQALIERRNKIINETIALKHYEGAVSGKYKPQEYVTKVFKKVDADGKSLHQEYLRILDSELKREGVHEEFFARDHELDIAKELQELNSKEGSPGVTKNPAAIKIAKIMNKLQEYTRARKNRAGAFIQNLDGYITKQSWNSELVRKAGFDEFRQRMLDELDIPKTFKDMSSEDVDHALRESFKGIVTGQHKIVTTDGDFLGGFTGPGNLGKKLSQHRLFHFKDAESWMKINSEFGNQSLHGSFMSHLQNSARSISMMENLGTNPENMYKHISTKVKREYLGDPNDVKQIDGYKNTALFKSLTGELSNPENMTLYKISDGILKWNMITKLGSSVISSLTDLPTKITELTYHGVHPLKAYTQTLLDTFRQFGASKEMSEYFLAGLEGYQSQFANKFMAEDMELGLMSKAIQKFFRLNMLEQWTDNHKAGFTHMLSNNLGQNADKEFSKLGSKLKNMLELYDIKEKDWNLLRETVHTSDSGTRYILTDKVEELSDAKIKSVFGEMSDTQVKRYRDELSTKLQRYFSNSADYAVVTPDVEDRYFTTLGTKRGTALGESVRLLMQFKSFPISVTKRMFERAGQVGDIGKFGMAATIAHMTLMGYVAMSIKDILKGKTPRDISNPETIGAAFMQGGGFGIYGDFLFSDYSRFGQSPVQTMAGPTAGTFGDLVKLFSQSVRSDWQGAGKTGINILKGNVPMVNLFYTRMALDYLIFNNLQEMVSPGYTSGLEQRTIDKGQEFWLPPSSMVGVSPTEFASSVADKALGGQ